MGNFKLQRRQVGIMTVIVVMISVAGWQLLRIRQFRERQHQIEMRGARVILAGYSNSSHFPARMRFINMFFIQSQIEVFLPSSEVADSVQDLLRDFPQCKRLWVHIDNVSPEAVERLKSMRPDVEYIRYD